MFKYYLNTNNSMTYHNCYEVHKKNCPIAKAMLEQGEDDLVALGFFDSSREAMASAKELLAEKGLDTEKANGCLACCKSCHKR